MGFISAIAGQFMSTYNGPNSVSNFNELAHLPHSLEWRPTWAGISLWCLEQCLAQHRDSVHMGEGEQL